MRARVRNVPPCCSARAASMRRQPRPTRRTLRSGRGQRRSATSANGSKSVRKVARFLNSMARCMSPLSTPSGNASRGPYRFSSRAAPDRADACDARVAVRGVTDKGEIVGNQRRLDAELASHPGRIADRLAPPVDLNDAVGANALRQVLVRRPDADLFATTGSPSASRAAAASASSASNSVMGQTTTPINVRASSSGSNCASSIGSMPADVFVAGPHRVAERLDDVVGGDADVRFSLL